MGACTPSSPRDGGASAILDKMEGEGFFMSDDAKKALTRAVQQVLAMRSEATALSVLQQQQQMQQQLQQVAAGGALGGALGGIFGGLGSRGK